MKLTYVYDLRLQFDGQAYYSKNFSDSAWEKYFDIVDEIHIYPMIQQVEYSNLSPIKSPLIMHEIPFQSTKSIYLNLKDMWSLAINIVESSEEIIIRLPSHMGIFVGLACIKNQKKYKVEVVGNALEAYCLHGNPLYKVIAPFLHSSMKKVVARADTAIYITSIYLQECYPNNQQVYNVVNASIKKHPVSVKWQQRPFTIGMIGSLETKYKGHATLFKALEELDKLNQPIIVRLLGEGKLKNLPRYNNVTVYHEGIIDQQEVARWYQSLQLYVQPSYTEAMGRSIMEAMSYGLPVVASNVGGIPELVEANMLFRVRDTKGMAKKIAALLYDPSLWQRVSTRNHAYIQQFEKSIVQEQRRIALRNYNV